MMSVNFDDTVFAMTIAHCSSYGCGTETSIYTITSTQKAGECSAQLLLIGCLTSKWRVKCISGSNLPGQFDVLPH